MLRTFFFQLWCNGTALEDPETKEDDYQAAQDLQRLQVLSREVTRALRQDDKNYFEHLLASMGDPNDQAVAASTWKINQMGSSEDSSEKEAIPTLAGDTG